MDRGGAGQVPRLVAVGVTRQPADIEHRRVHRAGIVQARHIEGHRRAPQALLGRQPQPAHPRRRRRRRRGFVGRTPRRAGFAGPRFAGSRFAGPGCRRARAREHHQAHDCNTSPHAHVEPACQYRHSRGTEPNARSAKPSAITARTGTQNGGGSSWGSRGGEGPGGGPVSPSGDPSPQVSDSSQL